MERMPGHNIGANFKAPQTILQLRNQGIRGGRRGGEGEVIVSVQRALCDEEDGDGVEEGKVHCM